MPAASDRTTVVAALGAVWDSLIELGSGFDDGQWSTASQCPGWTVKDNYSHMIGTELMLLDRPDETIDIGERDHVRNDIAKFNESSIVKRLDVPGPEVLAEFAAVTGERRAALAAMDDERFAEIGFTPAGQDTYGRFMQIRVFDCWIHEQDIRGPLDLPGHQSGPAVEVALDELTNSMGYVVGKKAGATEGQSVRLDLTGPTSRTIDVRVDGRAAVVDDLTNPTTTITMPTTVWFRFAAGRIAGDVKNPFVKIAGDKSLGTSVVENAAYTI